MTENHGILVLLALLLLGNWIRCTLGWSLFNSRENVQAKVNEVERNKDDSGRGCLGCLVLFGGGGLFLIAFVIVGWLIVKAVMG